MVKHTLLRHYRLQTTAQTTKQPTKTDKDQDNMSQNDSNSSKPKLVIKKAVMDPPTDQQQTDIGNWADVTESPRDTERRPVSPPPTQTDGYYRPESPVYRPESPVYRPNERDEDDVSVSNRSETRGTIDPVALEIAREFMSQVGDIARPLRRRKQLEKLYDLWYSIYQATRLSNVPFRTVLFAMAHGMKVLRVKHRGQVLSWNRYRDNEGNQRQPQERDQHRHRDDRRRDRSYDRRDERRRDEDRYERRDRGYERRDRD